MKCEGKYFCQLGRKIVERAQMKRKRGNKYGCLASSTGALKLGRKNGINCCKKAGNSKCCCMYQCCSGKAALDNYKNFRKSLVPTRVMYYWNGSWNDFSVQVLDSLNVAFSAGMPTVELEIDGSPYLVDFLRMLQIDLRVGCQRSIAWIDKNGSCFFPKVVLDGNIDEAVVPKVEVEVEIRISPTEVSNSEKYAGGAGNTEVSKSEKFCLPSNVEVSKTQKNVIPGYVNLLSTVPKLESGSKSNERIDKLTIDAPTGVNESGTGSRDAELLKVPKPEPVTDVPIKDLQVKQLLNKTSTEAPVGTNALEKGSYDVGLSKVPTSHLANDGVLVRLLSESQQWSSSVGPEADHLGDKLIKLVDGDEEFVAVQKCFLAGLSKVALATNVSCIYRNTHTSRLGQVRLQVFKKQVELTRNYRGNANVRYAWHGTSGTCLSTIMLHGFSNSRILDGGPAYGVGVYLAPEDRSYLSVPFSDFDKNGEQYAVLCRVILGNVEEVPLGSHQFHPSCEKFDSGVDDLTDPKHYIIWSTHMNTHILPEYVVSFKAPHQFHGCSDVLKENQGAIDVPKNHCSNSQDAQVADQFSVHEMEPCVASNKENQRKMQMPRRDSVRVPSSPCMPFMELVAIIGKFLPTACVSTLECLYVGYKAGRISRDTFINRVRMVAGDKLLIKIISSLQGQTDQMQVTRADHVPEPLLSSKKINMDNQSTLLTGQAIRGGGSQG